MDVRVVIRDNRTEKTVELIGSLEPVDVDLINKIGEQISQGTGWDITVLAVEVDQRMGEGEEVTGRPGYKALQYAVRKQMSQVDICYELASEIRMKSDSLRRTHNGLAREELIRREAHLKGLMTGLMISLGLPLESWLEINLLASAVGEERSPRTRDDKQ